jgi:hypothetical protein
MERHTENTFNASDDEVRPTHTNSIELIQSPEEVTQARHQAIEEAAYWRASERGFASGGELDDWLGAEANVDGVRSDTILEL